LDEMALRDKKVLIVVPARDFDGEEYDMTRRVLESKGLRPTVASTVKGPVRGTGGITANAEKLVKDCKSYDYDAVIFIGGPGARELQHDKDVTKFAEDVKYKVVGAFSTAVREGQTRHGRPDGHRGGAPRRGYLHRQAPRDGRKTHHG